MQINQLTEGEKFCLRSLAISHTDSDLLMAGDVLGMKTKKKVVEWFSRPLCKEYYASVLMDSGSDDTQLKSREYFAKELQKIAEETIDQKLKSDILARLMSMKNGDNEENNEDRIRYHLSLRCFDCSLWNMVQRGILRFNKLSKKWEVIEQKQ